MPEVKSVSSPPRAARAGFENAEAAAAPPRIELPAGAGTATKEPSRVAIARLAVGKAPRSPFESVIGPDERVRIFDTDLAPWRAICSLSIMGPNGNFMGTGWLAGKKTIITAGHCVMELSQMGGWASRIVVSAGRDDQTHPFGQIAATRFAALDRWVNQQVPDFDVGCIHLDAPLGDSTGWFGVLSPSPDELHGYRVNVAGYPSDLGGGRFLYHHRNSVKHVSARRVFYDTDTYGGQSGAPAWVHTVAGAPPLAVGIHAYGTGGTPATLGIEANSAPRISPEVAEIIRGWIAGNP